MRIGIDLGTTYSAVAYLNDRGQPEVIPNAAGGSTTPSVLVWDDNELLVGADAKAAAISSPENVAQFVKRSIGSPKSEWILGDRSYTAVELSRHLLAQLKRDAEEHLGVSVTEAVITVPAYFAEAQRANTMEAGSRAGLKVLGLINEPTAAAIDFGLTQVKSEQHILVYDLGGGTFDVTLLRVRPVTGDDQPAQFDIVATDGNAQLGGRDWDEVILQYIVEAFHNETGVDVTDLPDDYQQLVLEAEKAKQQLSARQSVSIDCSTGGERLRVELTRADFESQTRDLLEVTRTTVRDVLRESGIANSKVDTILLVGGSTRMPMVKAMLQEEFGKPPRSSPNPDEIVARGAALYTAILAGDEPSSGNSGPIMFLGGVSVRDVTSHTLGTLAQEGDRFIRSAIIPRNTTVPSRETRTDYVTAHDNQDSLVVPVLQGESDDPAFCDLIACWEFYGIPPRPTGASPLHVTFGYDVNGVVEVEARDAITGSQLERRVKEISGIDDIINPPAPPLRVVLCIDVSYSMEGSPLREAKKGAIDFVETLLGASSQQAARTGGALRDRIDGIQNLSSGVGMETLPGNDSDTQVAIVSFDDRAKVACKLLGNAAPLKSSINSLRVDGGTDIAAGISKSHRSAFGKLREEARRELVLFTDGGSSREPAIAAAEAAKRDGIVIRTIGCGHVDRELLAAIASSEDQADFINDASQIRASLANVAVQITQGLKAH